MQPKPKQLPTAQDVLYALATSPAGTRPLPLVASESAMRAVPVVVAIHDNGHIVDVQSYAFALLPHVAANTDPDKALSVGPEQHAQLVFHCRIPLGYHLVKDAVDVPDEHVDALPTEAVPVTTTRQIPEFAGLDPAIFQPNPDAVNRAMRQLHKKTINAGSDGGN